MEIHSFPRQENCGLRKLTTNHLVAARLAEQAAGLPPGVKHPNQLLAAMRRAAPYLGYTRLLPLMETLFRWTQPQDWAPGAEPIVWPSNEELALALDCSERHVSRLIATAIEARLIVAKDGTDRKRRGCRQDGRILWAWGFNLRPMAARHADFVQAAEAGERARRLCRDLRRQAGQARQFLAQLLGLAQERGLPTVALEEQVAAAQQIASALRRSEEPAKLEALVAALQALAAKAREALEEAVESANMSGSADHDVRPKLLTKTPTEPEGSTVAAQEEVAPTPALPIQPEIRLAEDGFRISPAELVRLAPRLENCLGTRQPGWSDIADAASLLAQQLGISHGLYGEACQMLGRHPAAVAIAIISTKQAGHFHSTGPGGYLRGMLRRAGKGELFLDRSIHGLREAAGYQRLGQLTAVNSAPRSALASMAPRKVRY
ncbi:plasmid replication protein RepC [Teichococcus wenyumeiae]|uniref:plasmid replication protein RepC n=1 Tax=Teichococcus wenyumeiae TaxID=2478470 RepID=UPI0013143A25|nr:plasmid replication protein RepC [Pseudoroseomonas wenyumeiae]